MEVNFKKVHTSKDLLISGFVFICGIALFFVSKPAGIVVALCGILSFILYKSGFKNENENVFLKKSSYELQKSCKQPLLNMINEGGNVPELRYGNEGGTIMLTLWHNKENRIVYAQLSEFQDFTFNTITEIVKLSPEVSEQLLESVK